MNIMVTPLAPPPGSTAIGDLYVDLQSRTMWLGVDPAVDPDGAVLLSDIVATDAAIEQVMLDANAYTDTQVATRALLEHTHTASQITDFDDAVEAVIGPSGGAWSTGQITLYFGALSNIGVGDLAGWALCDGSNGTPDMRDKFPLGAGNRNTGIANSLTKATTNVIGSHVHTINGTTLTIAMMPAHTHPVTASGSGSGSTDAQGQHTHSIGIWQGTSGLYNGPGGHGINALAAYSNTEPGGNHAHNVSVNVSVSGTASSTGGGTSHTHTQSTEGDHSHEITSTNLREAMPYMTLAFIMKL